MQILPRAFVVTGLTACLALPGLGCGGSVRERTDGGPSEKTARDLFDQTVQPLITMCAPCHAGSAPLGPGFLGSVSGVNYYDPLVASGHVNFADPASSDILTKGAHSTAPIFSAAQKAKIITWLDAENEERNGEPPDASVPAPDAAP
jgi:hypothetical protein